MLIFYSDIEKGGILPLIKTNIEKNKSYVKHPVIVKALDFTQPFSKEIEEVLPHVKVILAADGKRILTIKSSQTFVGVFC